MMFSILPKTRKFWSTFLFVEDTIICFRDFLSFSKSNGLKTGKSHLCAMEDILWNPNLLCALLRVRQLDGLGEIPTFPRIIPSCDKKKSSAYRLDRKKCHILTPLEAIFVAQYTCRILQLAQIGCYKWSQIWYIWRSRLYVVHKNLSWKPHLVLQPEKFRIGSLFFVVVFKRWVKKVMD